jgi:hypothetical protein
MTTLKNSLHILQHGHVVKLQKSLHASFYDVSSSSVKDVVKHIVISSFYNVVTVPTSLVYLHSPPDVEKISNSLLRRIEHGLLPNSRAWPKTESARFLHVAINPPQPYKNIRTVEDSSRSPKIAQTPLPPTLDWLGVAKFHTRTSYRHE